MISWLLVKGKENGPYDIMVKIEMEVLLVRSRLPHQFSFSHIIHDNSSPPLPRSLTHPNLLALTTNFLDSGQPVTNGCIQQLLMGTNDNI